MIYTSTEEEQMKDRLELIKASRRIVIKIGSAVLTTGNGVNMEVIDNIARDIKYLYDKGKEVILVTSGSVAAGRKKVRFRDENVITLKQKHALAAIGQSHLMHIYDTAFTSHDIHIAQVLLTHADLAHRSRYVNFKNTIFTLINMGVIPIINENDTVSTEELQFGDNDNLGALVTNLIEGDLFICLTDVDCLYTGNPQTDKDAKPVFIVTEIDADVEKMAGNSKSILGTGGMQSKIAAAKKVAGGGGASIIGPGRLPGVIQKIFNGDMIGTYFKPYRKKLQGRKQWIAFVLNPKGVLEVDSGACKAICNAGRSLLPSGITGVKGRFNAGDSVECHDSEGNVIAVGTVNYRAEDVIRIKGKHSDEIENILGYRDSDVLIHRDNLVVLS
jgi:glutamate 5-kinase